MTLPLLGLSGSTPAEERPLNGTRGAREAVERGGRSGAMASLSSGGAAGRKRGRVRKPRYPGFLDSGGLKECVEGDDSERSGLGLGE